MATDELSESDDDNPNGSDDQLYQAAIDQAKYDSQILSEVLRILKSRDTEQAPSDRVQLALDDLVEAACRRGCRILNNDLPPDLR